MNLFQVKNSELCNLVLTVREGEYVKIGDCFISVHEVKQRGKQVSLYFRAPRDVSIVRQRVIEAKEKTLK